MSCFGIFQVCNNTLDRYHADTMLEKYATETIMNLLTFFFNSPFSDSSTTIKVIINEMVRQFIRIYFRSKVPL